VDKDLRELCISRKNHEETVFQEAENFFKIKEYYRHMAWSVFALSRPSKMERKLLSGVGGITNSIDSILSGNSPTVRDCRRAF